MKTTVLISKVVVLLTAIPIILLYAFSSINTYKTQNTRQQLFSYVSPNGSYRVDIVNRGDDSHEIWIIDDKENINSIIDISNNLDDTINDYDVEWMNDYVLIHIVRSSYTIKINYDSLDGRMVKPRTTSIVMPFVKVFLLVLFLLFEGLFLFHLKHEKKYILLMIVALILFSSISSMEYNKSYHPDTVNVQNESEGFVSKANISISSNTMTFRHANYIDMFMLFDTDEFITISTPVNGNSNQNEYDFCIYEEYANLSVVGEDNFAFDLIFDGPDGVNS